MVAVEAQALPSANKLAARRKFAKNLPPLEEWLTERSAGCAAAKESKADSSKADSCFPASSIRPPTPTSVQRYETGVPSACERAHSLTSIRTEATPVTQMICYWQDDVGSPISTRK